jgi:hypothetical protein
LLLKQSLRRARRLETKRQGWAARPVDGFVGDWQIFQPVGLGGSGLVHQFEDKVHRVRDRISRVDDCAPSRAPRRANRPVAPVDRTFMQSCEKLLLSGESQDASCAAIATAMLWPGYISDRAWRDLAVGGLRALLAGERRYVAPWQRAVLARNADR